MKRPRAEGFVRFVKTRKAAAVGALFVLGLFAPLLAAIVRASVEEWRLDRRLAQVGREHARLTEERRRLQDDPTYVEGLIRSTFKLAKPGEVVIPLENTPSSARAD